MTMQACTVAVTPKYQEDGGPAKREASDEFACFVALRKLPRCAAS
jgi:hypothetical protein